MINRENTTHLFVVNTVRTKSDVLKAYRVKLFSIRSTIIFLIPLLFLSTASAEVLTRDVLQVGDAILIQNNETGRWCSPAISQFYADAGICSLRNGITDSSVFIVDIDSNKALFLEDTAGQSYALSLLANSTAFRYAGTSSAPTSNYAKEVEKQVKDIVGYYDGINLVAPEYDRWDVEPNYGIFYGYFKHTQGIAITSDGIWVQTQSAGGDVDGFLETCVGVLQTINPITERAIQHNVWDAQEGAECDPHTTGIQAIGNYIAVHSFNYGGIPDVKFFHVSPEGYLTEKGHLRLWLDDGNQYTQVGIVHVKEVGYFLYAKYVGGGKLYFRKDLSNESLPWKKLSNKFSGKAGPDLNEGGNKMIMEAETGNMYIFGLGTPPGNNLDHRNRFKVYVIKPDLKNYASAKEYWEAVANDSFIDIDGKTVNPEIKLKTVDEYILPGAGYTWIDHRFYFGGDVFVNETGRLDIIQAPRDLLNEAMNTAAFDQADYVVIRSKTGTPVNVITRGKVTRFKVLEETDDGSGDDEVYFVTNFKKGTVFENVSEGTEVSNDLICEILDCDALGIEPEPLMDVVSSSVNGTYVHLMEDDSGAVFGERPDTIGKIFIPPKQYAREGVHEYTTILTGDGGRYEVTYEVINEGSDELAINCESPDGLWYDTDILINCDWSYPPDLNGTFNLSTDVPNGTETDNAETVPYELCVLDLECVLVGPKGHHRVDKKPPVFNVTDITAEATGQLTTLDIGSPSVTDGGSGVKSITNNADILGFPLGKTVVTWTATDNVGNVSTKQQSVTLVDTTPPVIHSLTATPSVLWPPDNKMRPVRVITDVSDTVDDNPTCQLADIQVNPAIRKSKLGLPFEITGPDSALVLADRDGASGDRVYTLKVDCSDFTGNITSDTVNIAVPHDERKKK